MSKVVEPSSRPARMAGWAQFFLFSLNLAWIAVCYELGHVNGYLALHLSWRWPVQYLGWRVPLYMPWPPGVAHQVVLSLALSVPLFLTFLLLARVAPVGVFLRAFAGVFAITAYPLFALRFPDHFPYATAIAENATLLSLETGVVLVWGVLYCLRKWPLSWAVGVPLLFSHFSLWAWKAGNYDLYAWDVPSMYYPRIIVVLVATLFFFGFPVIGFLSALSSGLYFKLSSDTAATVASKAA